MSYGSSTFKYSQYAKDLINQNSCTIVRNLNFQTSTFNIPKEDNCSAYNGFLGKLNEIHSKVDSGDLSDFTELKL